MKNSTFKWNAKYETGLAEVDAQHKSLVELINHLGELRASGGSVADVTAALGALADYAKHHFSAEDALMQAAGISAEHTAAHRREHDQFLDQINQIINLNSSVTPIPKPDKAKSNREAKGILAWPR